MQETIKIAAPRLELARLPTPIEKLERASARLGREIFVKHDDLTDTLASGNKIRKLEYAIAEALAKGADTLISCGATQSNHARAVAAMGARLGLSVRLVLLGGENDRDLGNHLLDRLLGASIRLIDEAGWRERAALMTEEAESVRAAGGLAHVMPEGGSDATGTLGYVRAAAEITTQEHELGLRFDRVFCALGTGGTMAGLAAGFALLGADTRVTGICVCNDADYFRGRCEPLLAELAARHLPGLDPARCRMDMIEGYKGAGYGKSDDALRRELAELAREEGLLLDPVYTMKCWRGLRGMIEQGQIGAQEKLLFLHTGGLHGLLGKGGLFAKID